MKVLVIIIAVFFIIFALIVGSFVVKVFQLALRQFETGNDRRIEMSKEHERMKREFEDKWHDLR